MSGIAVEIRGEGCDRVAQDLRSRIARVSGGETSIEVERGVDPVAVVGMLFAGVQTAKTIWDWWQTRAHSSVTVNLIFGDGRVLELNATTRGELEEALGLEGLPGEEESS